MPERGYFDLRTLVPGYSFIILVVAINFYPLFVDIKLSDMSSIFAGIVALLGGPTLGFLVSQVWWWWFHWQIPLYKWRPIQELIKKYKLTKQETSQDKKKVLIVYDYLLHAFIHSSEEKKGLSTYAFRRWDMLVLLSTTRLSLMLGVAVGALFRILSEIFLFNWNIASEFEQNLFFFICKSEFWVLAIIIVGAILLIGFVWHGIKWVLNEYEGMHEAIIKETDATQEEIEKIFPDDYFQ
jgi:hypothetical protein